MSDCVGKNFLFLALFPSFYHRFTRPCPSCRKLPAAEIPSCFSLTSVVLIHVCTLRL